MAWMTAAQLRAFDDGLTDAATYSDDQLDAVISDVEAEIERIVGTAYDRRTVVDEWHLGDGSCWLRLDHRWPVAVTAASVGGTSLSAGVLAALMIDRRVGGVYLSSGWAAGEEVLVSYTLGRFTTTTVDDVTTYVSAAPADLLRAAKLLCRARLGQTRAPFMDRATRYQMDGGGMIVLDQAGPTKTGVPDVDAILARYIVPGIA